MYQYRKLTPKQQEEIVNKRIKKGFPPHTPPHPITNQPFYLLTAACYEHKKRMNNSQRRQEILSQLLEIFQSQEIEVLAWVILPNHYHLLTRTVDFKWLSQQIRLIHGRLARQWNLEDNLSGKMWCSYSDRAIRSEQHYYRVLNYIHYNPVKHHYVKSPYDWSESSVHWYYEDKGRDWLRDCWVKYPVRDYGKDWDD
ncbi:MAG: transposase [Microcystaceae cyanobacterium]